jgi:hypothetical protein
MQRRNVLIGLTAQANIWTEPDVVAKVFENKSNAASEAFIDKEFRTASSERIQLASALFRGFSE